MPEQNASKIVKISQQMAKLWQKLKWLVFFWDTVYTPRTLFPGLFLSICLFVLSLHTVDRLVTLPCEIGFESPS